MQLTTINPRWFWANRWTRNYGTSLALIERILGGKDPMVPDIGFGIVDVADISAMHVAALERPESIGHRFIGSNGTMTMPRIAQHLAARIPTGRSRRGSRRNSCCG
jgi:dihydroflavonol-4-reductase